MERRGSFERNTSEKTYGLGKARDAWRETMLDVRLDGEAFALPYAHLSLIKLEGENILTLSFATHLVKLRGEKLRPLYDSLMDQAVRYVMAAAPRAMESAPESETTIKAIELTPLNQTGEESSGY